MDQMGPSTGLPGMLTMPVRTICAQEGDLSMEEIGLRLGVKVIEREQLSEP